MPEPIVTLDEESLRADLRELVRGTVEEVLDGLLDEEAGDLVGAERYERTADREAYRAGHYERKLATTSGEVAIRMPELKGMRFTTAIVERHRRREASVEEAMMEMYLAGASTRRIEDVGETPWGPGASAATVSDLNEKASEAVEERRNGPLERAHPYACVDGLPLLPFGVARHSRTPNRTDLVQLFVRTPLPRQKPSRAMWSATSPTRGTMRATGRPPRAPRLSSRARCSPSTSLRPSAAL